MTNRALVACSAGCNVVLVAYIVVCLLQTTTAGDALRLEVSSVGAGAVEPAALGTLDVPTPASTRDEDCDLSAATDALAQVERQVGLAWRQLNARLSPTEEFERSSENLQLTLTIRGFVEAALSRSTDPPLRVEVSCRGSACRFDVFGAPLQQAGPWVRSLAESRPLSRRIVRARSGFERVSDPLTGRPAVRLRQDVRIRSPGEMSATNVLIRVGEDFRASEEYARCDLLLGDGVLRVALMISEGRLSYSLTGTLQDTPGGICIEQALQSIIREAWIPRDAIEAEFELAIRPR